MDFTGLRRRSVETALREGTLQNFCFLFDVRMQEAVRNIFGIFPISPLRKLFTGHQTRMVRVVVTSRYNPISVEHTAEARVPNYTSNPSVK